MLVASDPAGAAIDMPAGPSEVLIITDKDARADFIAADLLSQAEHGADSQVVLVSLDSAKITEVQQELDRQIATLPRKETAEKALANSFSVLCESFEDAMIFANQYAPEHLIINIDQPDRAVPLVQNAGSVFLGPYACESAGDYASGTNHVLPTYGYARSYSGVSLTSFQKRITFQTITADGAKQLGPTVALLAEREQLTAHQRAMEIRFKQVDQK